MVLSLPFRQEQYPLKLICPVKQFNTQTSSEHHQAINIACKYLSLRVCEQQ